MAEAEIKSGGSKAPGLAESEEEFGTQGRIESDSLYTEYGRFIIWLKKTFIEVCPPTSERE
jgi:hypothetical protein